MSESVLVEACVDSIESSLAAARGGAHGIELCANLVEGGTTPSAGTLAVCRERLDIPIHVLVRPRGGDFLYTAAEFTVMLEDIRRAKQAGAEGVGTGALRARHSSCSAWTACSPRAKPRPHRRARRQLADSCGRRRAGPRFSRGAASRRTTWPRWCARPASPRYISRAR